MALFLTAVDLYLFDEAHLDGTERRFSDVLVVYDG